VYIPMLRAKGAELRALELVAEPLRDSILPHVELVPRPSIKTSSGQLWSDSDFAEIALSTSRAWGFKRRIILDAVRLGDGPVAGRHPIDLLVEQSDLEYPFVPVFVSTLGRSPEHDAAHRRAVDHTGNGAAIRVERWQIEAGSAASIGTSLSAALGLPPSEVDLILNFGRVTSGELGGLIELGRLTVETLESSPEWRSVSIVSGGFPDSVGVVPPGQEGVVRRLDRELWLGVTASVGAASPRKIAYGDYGPLNAAGTEEAFDPRTMHMTVNLRYAADQGWLLIRGRSARRGYDQVRDLARRLVSRSEYKGASFSWGDAWIASAADDQGTTGNPATWLQVALSHQLALVVDELTD
jgi:hypothetical protein